MVAISNRVGQKIPLRFPKYHNVPPKQKNPNPIAIEGGIYTFGANTPNGQFSEVVISGNSVNQIVQNGNFADGTTKWTGSRGVLSASGNTLSITGDGVSPNITIYQDTIYAVRIGNKLYYRIKVRVTDSLCSKIQPYIHDTGFHTVVNLQAITSPVINQWYTSQGVATIPSDNTGNVRVAITSTYADAATANGKVMQVQEAMTIDMTAEGLSALTADEMNTRFPNWLPYGTNSTLPVRIQSKDALGVVQSEVNTPTGITLRSVDTVKDKFNVGTGVETQEVGVDTDISGTDYASIDTATYTNVDVVKTTAFALATAGTAAIDGKTRYFDKDGKELTEVAQANIDLVASVGKYYYHTDKTIWAIVANGAYADIATARTGLGTTSLNYQLAKEVVNYYPDAELVTGPGWTISVESTDIDAGNSTVPTMVISPPPGLLLPMDIDQKDIYDVTVLDQDFVLI